MQMFERGCDGWGWWIKRCVGNQCLEIDGNIRLPDICTDAIESNKNNLVKLDASVSDFPLGTSR